MTYLPPGPIHAEDPLAYFTILPVPAGVPAALAEPRLRPMPELDQIYAYYNAPGTDPRR